MITLGINAAFHDSAAALVVDGEVVAAAEEERFSRIKHAKRPVPFAAWELPWQAIDYCLGSRDLALSDVDHVAYSFAPQLFIGDADEAALALPHRPTSGATAARWESPWDPLFATAIVSAPEQLHDGAPHHLRARFASEGGPSYRWHFVPHHLCHQASAFLAAPFSRCAVMTLDGRGERATTAYGAFDGRRYRDLGEVRMPSSLGMLYEAVTTHLGFLHSSDEYKVMALAALGAPTFAAALSSHVSFDDEGGYAIAPIDLRAIAGPPRRRGGRLEQVHLDLAASLQDVLEETVLRLSIWLRESSRERRLAMAGGVALNCVMNARLRDAGIFDEVWIQPAAGDAGTALGAALWTDAVLRDRAVADRPGLPPANDRREEGSAAMPTLAPRRWQMQHAYLGPGYGAGEIEAALSWPKLAYRRVASEAELADAVSAHLAADRIVGWYQGRMEFGPRALGARSILASPLSPEMQSRLNELKDREDFRPVAPAVLSERFAEWFEPSDANGGESPFMLFTYRVAPGRAARIPSALHSDNTARVQTVDRNTNPRFHALLAAFERRTGVPVLVNTSFNVRGEPIVCTPRQAIEAFFSTPLDVLAIGDFIVEKPS